MARHLPLQGIRVADFTWVWAGPFCTLQLAHLGAEVIRVETAAHTCVTRLLPPWADGEFGANRSGYFNQYNQGKLSLSLDLKQAEAPAIARELVAKSDIVCENFAAGVMDRLGLGYEALRAVRPDVIMIALSGYGATGPESEFVSYGPAQVPLAGMSSLTGYAGWPPMHVGISYGDPNGGLHGAFAVLAALLHRARTGEGQYIDLSQQETTIAVLAEGLMEQGMRGAPPERNGNRDPWMAPHGNFACAGADRWVSIAVQSDEEWATFAQRIGRPELGRDARFVTLEARKRNEDEVEAIVSTWTAQKTAEEVTMELQQVGIAAFPCMTNKDIATDPHLLGRDFFTHLDHPEVGARQHVGIPWKLHGSPLAVRRPAPCQGQHTDEILRDILGYDEGRIAELRRAGVLC